MKAFTLLGMLLLLMATSIAQNNFIRYDVATGSVEYMRVKRPGDTVHTSHIDLSRGRDVQLYLTNMSGGYRRTVRLIEEPRAKESLVLPFFGALGGGGDLWKGMLQFDTTTASPEHLFNLIQKKTATKNNNKILEEEDATLRLAREALLKTGIQYTSFRKTYEAWLQAVLFEENCNLLWKELAGLRYSLQLPAAEVKKQAVTKTRAVFPDIVNNPASIVLQKGKDPTRLAAAVDEQYRLLMEAYNQYRSYGMPPTSADTLVLQAGNQADQVQQIKLPASTSNLLPRISELYRLIISDRYTQQVPLMLNPGSSSVELILTPQTDTITADMLGIQPTDTPVIRRLPLYKKEPLRFRNSFGVSFTRFADYRWRYFVNDVNKIDRESSDEYVPVIVTYLHFYTPKDRGFRWGGSFGAGLPVSGDNRQVHLMLGLSTFFGKNDPVVITAGVCGAQVRKLTGYTLGDVVAFTELQDNNYRMVNRIGYFVSLTFNPSSLVQNNQ